MKEALSTNGLPPLPKLPARGRQVGRKRLIDAAKLEQARILRAGGQTIPGICQVLNVSGATLYRAFSQDAPTETP